MSQIYEIFGKRLRIEKDYGSSCMDCALRNLGVCGDTLCCYDSERNYCRHFVEVDSDGNDIES